MENDRINSQKLIFHPNRVAEWLNTGEGFPINVELAISGACNHRCVFCCVDYMKYAPTFLPVNIVHDRMLEMYGLGLKSVLLAGNGEPLLHKDAVEIINDLKDIGLDVALSTNGVLFTRDKAEKCMYSLSWIRFSTSAGTEENYKKIHRGKDGDLSRLFQNIADAAQIKQQQGLKTVLNVQIIMTPDNIDEVVLLARKVKELGADRFIVKTVGTTSKTENKYSEDFKRTAYYDQYSEYISNELSKLKDDDFQCVFRYDRLQNLMKERNYQECLASVFHVCIDSEGFVVPCCGFLGGGIDGMSYGNINDNTFSDIWNGDKRKQVLNKLKETKLKGCPPDCKLANMNCYLQELITPGAHVNFI
jgi:MoaA/NifB/PqqE/SkfB family radical SAM enzyme